MDTSNPPEAEPKTGDTSASLEPSGPGGESAQWRHLTGAPAIGFHPAGSVRSAGFCARSSASQHPISLVRFLSLLFFFLFIYFFFVYLFNLLLHVLFIILEIRPATLRGIGRTLSGWASAFQLAPSTLTAIESRSIKHSALTRLTNPNSIVNWPLESVTWNSVSHAFNNARHWTI